MKLNDLSKETGSSQQQYRNNWRTLQEYEKWRRTRYMPVKMVKPEHLKQKPLTHTGNMFQSVQ